MAGSKIPPLPSPIITALQLERKNHTHSKKLKNRSLPIKKGILLKMCKPLQNKISPLPQKIILIRLTNFLVWVLLYSPTSSY